MKNRIQRIFSHSDKKLDVFIIVNSDFPNTDPNFFYISGIKSGVFEHCYIIGKRDRGYILTSELEEPIARKETDLEIITFKKKDDLKNSLKKILSGAKCVGINSKVFSYDQYLRISKLTKAKIVDMSGAFSKARSIKDEDEIKSISEACRISSKVAEEFPAYIKQGVTEKELSKKLVELQYRHGADNLAFSPPIVAFGQNAASPHHFPTDRKLKENEFVLIDFGAQVNRYGSDISRTFVFGKADKKMKEMYETVIDAQLKAIGMVKHGANGKKADKVARDIIEKKFKGRFIHSLGHEVGLSIHDGGVLSPNQKFILKENMVVTVEPGVYIPEIGGVRIEDTVLVTKNKAKILTNAPKELIEI